MVNLDTELKSSIPTERDCYNNRLMVIWKKGTHCIVLRVASSPLGGTISLACRKL